MDVARLAALDEHAVDIYDDDAALVAAVAAYAADGLARGERVLVALTPAHRGAVDDALHGAGVDAAAARRDGSFVTLEAGHTLSTFLVDGRPDRAAFADTVGRMVATACEDGTPVRIFGEMVSILWDRGDVVGALELEELWNDLAQVERFTLLCGYRSASMAHGDLADVSRMCALHTSVRPPSSYHAPGPVAPPARLAGGSVSSVFVPVPQAVVGARRYVVDVLESWGQPSLVGDAALVTSELATNALLHGGSPFRVSVSLREGLVRISIEDVAHGWPERQTPGSQDVHGRGVAIVHAVSHRSGCDLRAGGKVAWAELSAQPRPGAVSGRRPPVAP